MTKYKVLYIAKNIPTPKKKTNRIIFDIAKNVSEFCNIDFAFPKEVVPFWLRNHPRFSYLYKQKDWIFEGFNIKTISYIKLPFKPFQYWTLCYLPGRVKKLIKKGTYNLVHAHYLFPDGYLAYKIFQKLNIPYVLTFRNQDKQYLEIISRNNLDYKKARCIFENASSVITPNLAYKQFVEKQFNITCQIVPHGIPATLFDDNNKQTPNDVVIITTVAEAIPRKNIDWVIQAFKTYSGNTKIKLNIVGDGPELNKLKELSDGNPTINFFGHIPHNKVLQLLQENDIFALPSFNETFGMVYLEAAATHNAVIGLKGEGVWGVFEENNEMMFCDNYKSFEQQLHILIDDREMRQNLKNKAAHNAQNMRWEKLRERYMELYLSALKQDETTINI